MDDIGDTAFSELSVVVVGSAADGFLDCGGDGCEFLQGARGRFYIVNRSYACEKTHNPAFFKSV